jgi:hypothetical protein
MVRIAAVLVLLLVASSETALAFDPPVAIKEPSAVEPLGSCFLSLQTNGTCSNYRWYNVCSDYIWIYLGALAGEAVGTRFGGPEQPCVRECRTAKRVLTYWRNIAPGYGQTVDVYLDHDGDSDGCPDRVLASDLDLDPYMRWNCHDMDVCLGSGSVIVRLVHDGGYAPSFATDGPHNQRCDTLGTPRSYYYGVGTVACVPGVGPTSRADNFLVWLIIDTPEESECSGCSEGTEQTSWGRVKGLFR